MLMSVGSIRRVLLVLLLAWSPLAQAQRQAPEPELKAAILVNMLLFVDWPNQTSQPSDRVALCYLDAGPVAQVLDLLNGKIIKGRPLQVLHVNAAAAAGCHALYLSPNDATALTRMVPGLSNRGVLFVGDSPGYLQRGVMLNLEVENGRIVFDIDLRSARQAGLVMSSKVLRLARRVME
ncbi:MAG: YfiR family protein [Rhodoferax sp.]|nr:YfiR family protein [Rhodoferax sp.]